MHDVSTEDILSLMNIYLTEWCHLDEHLWRQLYTYFYATLVVLFLPNATIALSIDDLPKLPLIIFPIIAICMAVIFLYVSLAYALRLKAIGDTYMRLIKFLPEKLQRISIADINTRSGKLLKRRVTFIMPSLMFIGLCVMSIIMIVYYCSIQ